MDTSTTDPPMAPSKELPRSPVEAECIDAAPLEGFSTPSSRYEYPISKSSNTECWRFGITSSIGGGAEPEMPGVKGVVRRGCERVESEDGPALSSEKRRCGCNCRSSLNEERDPRELAV